MILLDTSGLLAALDASQQQHESAAAVLRASPGPFLLSPFVLAELDYLVSTRVGANAEIALLDEVTRGTYRLQEFDAGDLHVATTVIEQYVDLALGLADASLVVLSQRHDALDLLTLDERHFRTVTGARGQPFRILPADA